jgi:hypothetical protein
LGEVPPPDEIAAVAPRRATPEQVGLARDRQSSERSASVRVDESSERVQALEARLEEVTARLDTLTARLDTLTARFDALVSELGAG